MVDFLEFTKNNCYIFDEKNHFYYYNYKRVQSSVTGFIDKYFNKFDRENVSKRYAEKHGMSQEEVLRLWDDKASISAISGTMIHSYLENMFNRRSIELDVSNYSKEERLYKDINSRVEIIKPKADKFLKETYNRLLPIKTEYTVGYKDLIAGNIDLICYNKRFNEIQIWDYKNTKEISKFSYGNKRCLSPFENEFDCNFIHYSIQLSFYKALIQNLLGIQIGKMYLVHFNYNDITDNFDIIPVKDFSEVCWKEVLKIESTDL